MMKALPINRLIDEPELDLEDPLVLSFLPKNWTIPLAGNRSEDLDLSKVKSYVEETYYDMDYKSPQYNAPRLKARDFV
jgi:hypothetical protein